MQKYFFSFFTNILKIVCTYCIDFIRMWKKISMSDNKTTNITTELLCRKTLDKRPPLFPEKKYNRIGNWIITLQMKKVTHPAAFLLLLPLHSSFCCISASWVMLRVMYIFTRIILYTKDHCNCMLISMILLTEGWYKNSFSYTRL